MTTEELDEFLLNAYRSGLLIGDKSIPSQYAFVIDASKSLAALTTRRAGKTTALAHRFLRTLLKHPGSFCPYIALTRDSARNIMWQILKTETKRFHINAVFNENLTMTLDNGSKLQLFGADMQNFIDRLRGIKTPGAAIDEAQSFRGHIQELVQDVIRPGQIDYPDAWTAICGTPGPVPNGYFYDITDGKHKHLWSTHRWSLFDNKYLPNPRQAVEEEMRQNGWTIDTPTYRREYLGLWEWDPDALIIKYDPKADYDQLPPANWNYILGIDLGFNDADALAVLAWSTQHPATYLVEESVITKQGLTELVQQIKALEKKYKFSKMIIDEGGLGKKLAEEMRRQHQIPVHAAEKTRKMETIAFLNDAIRTDRFKAKKNSRFAEDSYKVQLDKDKTTPDRIVVKDSFHSDIIDAVLYGFKESPAYSYSKEPPKPKYGTPEWANDEVKRMEEEAFERALKDAEEAKGLNQWY